MEGLNQQENNKAGKEEVSNTTIPSTLENNDIQFPCMLGPEIDESQIFTTDLKALDQTAIEVTILKKLAVVNGLNYFISNFIDSDSKNLFSQLIDLLKIENANHLNAQIQFANLIEKVLDSIKTSISRYLVNPNSVPHLRWDKPSYIHFYQLNALRAKRNMQIYFPYLESDQFKTMPKMPPGHRYLVSIINCEFSELQSKLLDAFIKNVALTLNNIVSIDKTVTGATLILKGRISRELLIWLRGSSPLEPSPIPHIEIIYGIPVLAQERSLSQEEYLFTLKKGGKYRLLKNNKNLSEASAKSVHKMWQELRSYVVVDELINVAIANSSGDYNSFIANFWNSFAQLHSPQPDIPDWRYLVQTNNEEMEKIVEQKIIKYKQSLEEELNKKNKMTVGKTGRLIELLNTKENFTKEVSVRVREIAEQVDLDKTDLFYLDWDHIIYDALKDKDYHKSTLNLTEITPELLTKYNQNYQFSRNRCYLKIKNSLNGNIEISFSEHLWRELVEGKSDRRNFNWTLLSIIMMFSQLKIMGGYIDDYIRSYFDQVLKYVSLSEHQFFIKFINAYNQSNDNTDQEISEAFQGLRKDQPEEFDLIIINKLIHILDEKLKQYKNAFKSAKEKEKKDVEEKMYEENNLFNNLFSIPESNDFKKSVNAKDELLDEVKENYEENISNLIYIEHNTIEKIIRLLEETPLIGGTRISLAYVKSMLKIYEPSMDDFIINADEIVNEKTESHNFFILNAFLGTQQDSTSWRYFYFLNTHYKCDNVVKFIYAILQDDVIKVAHEPLRGDRSESFALLRFSEDDVLTLKRYIQEVMSEGNSLDEKLFLKIQDISLKNHVWTNVKFKSKEVEYLKELLGKKQVKELSEKLLGGSRPTHSELANGLGIKAGGELIFYYDGSKWSLIVINNGSGHYRPAAHLSLQMACRAILHSLNKSIFADSVSLLNSLKPGMTLASGFDEENDQVFIPIMDQWAPTAKTDIGTNSIGPRNIPHWILTDVKDKGNCFYLAVVDQLQLIDHPFIKEVPSGTDAHDSLRLRVQGVAFKDKEWAGHEEIIETCKKLNIIVAIVDTRYPALGFVYHHINQEGKPNSQKSLKGLPHNPIVRIAYTGNHYLSVTSTNDLETVFCDYTKLGEHKQESMQNIENALKQIKRKECSISSMKLLLNSIIQYTPDLGDEHPILKAAKNCLDLLANSTDVRDKSHLKPQEDEVSPLFHDGNYIYCFSNKQKANTLNNKLIQLGIIDTTRQPIHSSSNMENPYETYSIKLSESEYRKYQDLTGKQSPISIIASRTGSPLYVPKQSSIQSDNPLLQVLPSFQQAIQIKAINGPSDIPLVAVTFDDVKVANKFSQELYHFGVKKKDGYPPKVNEVPEQEKQAFVVYIHASVYDTIMDDKDAYSTLVSIRNCQP